MPHTAAARAAEFVSTAKRLIDDASHVERPMLLGVTTHNEAREQLLPILRKNFGDLTSAELHEIRRLTSDLAGSVRVAPVTHEANFHRSLGKLITAQAERGDILRLRQGFDSLRVALTVPDRASAHDRFAAIMKSDINDAATTIARELVGLMHHLPSDAHVTKPNALEMAPKEWKAAIEQLSETKMISQIDEGDFAGKVLVHDGQSARNYFLRLHALNSDRQLTIAEYDRLTSVMKTYPGVMPLDTALDLTGRVIALQGGQTVATRVLPGLLSELRRHAHALAESHPNEHLSRQIQADIGEVVGTNISRMTTRFANNGYANFPDYAEIGDAMASIRLLRELRQESGDDIGTRADAKVTWR
jgi:hypothetical protein